MMSLVRLPDLMIYIRSSISTLVAQIQKRGREYEQTMRLDYLQGLEKRYEDWMEVILAAELVEPVIAYCELDLVDLLPDAVKSVDLVSIKTRTSHYADVAEFRGRSSLFKIAGVDILVSACITGVSEQIGIDYVFKFIGHKNAQPPIFSILKILLLFAQ